MSRFAVVISVVGLLGLSPAALAPCKVDCYLFRSYNDYNNDYRTDADVCITYAAETNGLSCPKLTKLGGTCGGAGDLMRAPTVSCRCCAAQLQLGQNAGCGGGTLVAVTLPNNCSG